MKLTAKLVWVMLSLSMVGLSGSTTMLYIYERRHLFAQMEQNQVATLEKLGRVCAESMLDENDLSRLAYLKTFWASSPKGLISFAVFLDGKGRVLMHSDFLSADLSLLNQKLPEEAARGIIGGSEDSIRRSVVEGPRPLSVHSAPVKVGGRRVGTVAVAYDKLEEERFVRSLQRDSFTRSIQAGLFGLVLSLGLAVLFAKTLVHPIKELAIGTRRIGQGDWKYRIPVKHKDELGDLAGDFNSMAHRLGEIDEIKDSFISKITHDLRNPLSSVIGFAELLHSGPLSSEQVRPVEIILKNGNYLSELVDNILDVTKLEAGRMVFARKPVPLLPCVQEVLETMRNRADEYSVRLDCSGVPAWVVLDADEQALKRILMNLVSNALKFTPAGGTVSVEWNADVVSVRDTGIGIPNEKIGSLFQKFSQIAETRGKVRETKGTGLGLVICKEMVEAHGGRIWVESEYRKWTAFLFTIPPASPSDGGKA
jgi:signal transduction histidine kinase